MQVPKITIPRLKSLGYSTQESKAIVRNLAQIEIQNPIKTKDKK